MVPSCSNFGVEEMIKGSMIKGGDPGSVLLLSPVGVELIHSICLDEMHTGFDEGSCLGFREISLMCISTNFSATLIMSDDKLIGRINLDWHVSFHHSSCYCSMQCRGHWHLLQ